MAEVYIAKQGAIVEYDGRPTVIKKGRTRVEVGHELLTRFPGLFEPASDNAEFRVTTARQEPYPEGDPAKSWTVAQITAWAGANSIDLPKGPKGAVVKAALAGLAARQQQAPPADSGQTPPEGQEDVAPDGAGDITPGDGENAPEGADGDDTPPEGQEDGDAAPTPQDDAVTPDDAENAPEGK